MRLVLPYALTVLCCSPGLLLAGQAMPEQTVPASHENQERETKRSTDAALKTRPAPDRSENKLVREVLAAVRKYLEQEGGKRFGITDVQKEIRISRIESDPTFPDRRVVRGEQIVRGVPVFGTQTTFVVKPTKGVVSATSGLAPAAELANVDTTPTIRWFDAVGRAIAAYRQTKGSTRIRSCQTPTESCSITAQLQIFEPTRLGLKAGVARLAWLVRLDTLVVFIDAHDGTRIFRYNDLQSSRHRLTYDLEGGADLGHGLVMDENGPVPGVTISHDAKTAHSGAASAYSFFRKLGRDSYDNGGAKIESNVRADNDSYGQWHVGAKMLVYRLQAPDALDIIGHEFTHGVIQHSAGLHYFDEPGALNESFADYFGAEIEAFTSHKHNWTIGEGLNLPEGPLRNMADPHNGGFNPQDGPWPWNRGQPDHYTEKVTAVDNICKFSSYAEKTSGCIHLNSGIFNKAAYLAAAGGIHHGVTVKGIGRKKLTRILYETLEERLDPSSDMNTAAQAIVTSCKDLIGQYGISTANCADVKNAFAAIGLPVP
jgi:Zn-dependent metalloprotease